MRSPSTWRPPTSWGDVDDVVSADDCQVHLPLRLIVLRLFRAAEDEVHVRVESLEDPAVSSPALQLNHDVRVDPLVEERQGLDHRTNCSERGALLKGLRMARDAHQSCTFRRIDGDSGI